MARVSTVINETVGQINYGLAKTNAVPGQRQAEALQTLGTGISNLGTGLSSYLQKIEIADASTKRQQYKQTIDTLAQDVHNEALTSENVKPDSSNLVDEYDSMFKESATNMADELGVSGSDKDMFMVMADEAKNSNREKLYAQQRIKHAEYTELAAGEILKKSLADTFRNPENFQKNLLTDTDHMNALDQSSFIDQNSRTKLLANHNKDMALSAISGMAYKKDYAKARERIISGDLSGVFDRDGMVEAFALIDSARAKNMQLDIQEASLEKSIMKEESDQHKKQEISGLMGNIANAKTPEELTLVRKKIERSINSFDLDQQDYSYLNKVADDHFKGPDQDIDDGLRLLQFEDNINQDRFPPAAMISAVKNAAGRTIKTYNSINLLQKIEARENLKKSDPILSKRIDDQADYVVGQIMDIDPITKQLVGTKEQRTRANNALDLFRRYTNPQAPDRLDPKEASTRVLDEVGAVEVDVPLIPGVKPIDQMTSADMAALFIVQEKRKNLGEITQDEFKRMFYLIEEKQKILKKQEASDKLFIEARKSIKGKGAKTK